ncbi:hypothetical protein KJ910_00075 [Patescibacteria group bacterium]|nr:hypothetical protein [Patescibacteria group bacterium]MBU1906581.1 hypothetical protein [Patescibacteria group bacterium]
MNEDTNRRIKKITSSTLIFGAAAFPAPNIACNQMCADASCFCPNQKDGYQQDYSNLYMYPSSDSVFTSSLSADVNTFISFSDGLTE